MGTMNRLAIALSLVLATAGPGFAGMAVIETTAPLADHTNESVRQAVMAAVQNAAKGAAAMGLPRLAVKGVHVLPQMVVVQVLATDADSEPALEQPPRGEDEDLRPGGESVDPGNGPAPGSSALNMADAR